jgi:hypothetical protein
VDPGGNGLPPTEGWPAVQKWHIYFLKYPPPTLIHLSHPIYQCLETCSVEVFWLLSQPLVHQGDLVGHHLWLLNFLERIFWPSCELLYSKNTFHPKQERFLHEYPLQKILLPTKIAQQNAALRYHTPQAWSPFWLLKPASEHALARLLPGLSWCWTVLLHSDTCRKPITSITIVLPPFETYLLTLPHIYTMLCK